MERCYFWLLLDTPYNVLPYPSEDCAPDMIPCPSNGSKGDGPLPGRTAATSRPIHYAL